MKKLIYTLALSAVIFFSLASCTQEVIKPKAGTAGAGVIE